MTQTTIKGDGVELAIIDLTDLEPISEFIPIGEFHLQQRHFAGDLHFNRGPLHIELMEDMLKDF